MPIQNGCMMHTMIRVGNIARSIAFYTEFLGMKVLRTKDHPEDKFTLVFLGYGPEPTNTVVELTYNYGVDSYKHGESFGHLCVGCDDVPAAVALAKKMRIEVIYESDDAFMAFVKDPDGYEVELLNKARMFKEAEEDYAKADVAKFQQRTGLTGM